MKKTDHTKYLALGISLIAWGIFISGFQTIAATIAVVPVFILAMTVHKNGPLFTIAVSLSFATAGLLVDLPIHQFPPATVFLVLISIIMNARIWFFDKMYLSTALLFEAIAINCATAGFIISAYLTGYTWQQWVIGGAPILLFSLFSTVIYKDRKLANDLLSKQTSQKGNKAPDFTLPDQDGNAVALQDLLIKNHLLLIFVRGDWCPTCHVMLRGYHKNKEKFAEKNIRIVGIGPDPQGVNKEMVERIDQQSLMLSDREQETAAKYSGTLQPNTPLTKNNYKNGIPLPASFLVHQNGTIIYTSRSDKAAEVLQPDKIFEVLNLMN